MNFRSRSSSMMGEAHSTGERAESSLLTLPQGSSRVLPPSGKEETMSTAIRQAPARFRVLGLLGALLGAAAPAALGAGFELFDQAAKPAGMAGAFVAQANDPSAV